MKFLTAKTVMAATFSTFFFIHCEVKQPAAPTTPPPVLVSTQVVKVEKSFYYDEYPATVVALEQVELRPLVSGYLTSIHFKEGEEVKKGQKLYSIDPRLFATATEQAEANLAVQQANLSRAKMDAERYAELDKKDAVAKQTLDNAVATFEAAKKQVEAAKANLNNLKVNQQYTTVYAPFDGIMGISQVKQGAALIAGQTLLNTISSIGAVGVDFTVDQTEIPKFSALASRQSINDSIVRLSFGNEIYPEPGKISFLDRAVDVQTGTIKVRAEFPNGKNLLRPGMTGTLKIKNKSDDNVVLVPFKAIGEQLGEFIVYIVHDSTVAQQKVVLGKQNGLRVMVLEGLKQGDTIAVEGIQKLKEGSKIKIAALPPAAPKNNSK